MSRLTPRLCALFASTFLAAPCFAGTLSYNTVNVVSPQYVQLSGTPVVNGSASADAGQIVLQNVNGTTNTLRTFCIDVGHFLQNSGSFTTGGYVTGALGNTINALISNVVPTFASDVYASAALQVAIWTAEYGSSVNISTSTQVANDAQSFLVKVNNGFWQADSTKVVAKLDGGGGNQSQAYLVAAASAVPEPASMALLGAGLATVSVAGLRRGRRTA